MIDFSITLFSAGATSEVIWFDFLGIGRFCNERFLLGFAKDNTRVTVNFMFMRFTIDL